MACPSQFDLRLVFDIECNALENPTQVWVVVAKDIDTGEYHVFRRPTQDDFEARRLTECFQSARLLIGHFILGFDLPILSRLLHVKYDVANVIDTLVVSRLVDYPRNGHSIEDYGLEFGLEKGKFNEWGKFSQEMEDYCRRDVDICHRIYSKYHRYISNPDHSSAINLEQSFQEVCNRLTANGFAFNKEKAERLLKKVEADLAVLDKDILEAFPPRLSLIREIHPEVTKHGTLHKKDFRFVTNGDLSEYNGGPFCRCSWEPFNPSSHKQIVDVLHHAGWRPIDKTKTHIDTERSLALARRRKNGVSEIHDLTTRLEELKKTGYKVNEANLETLPASAPKPARLLAKRILLESRRRTLVEWLDLVQDGRIHPRFQGIGAWTHRMAHQNPNCANIPNEFDTQGKKKLLGKELRSLWCAPKNRLLGGCDAEGIQLRIFAHYINDPEFTDALVKGKKDDKTDPHSLNQRILGDACKSRAAAKRFIYALLLGAGIGKLSEILDTSNSNTQQALERLLSRYSGWATLKDSVFPRDAKRGWFIGLDGRKIRIPGDTESSRRHLAMSGYLQSGEAIVMKKATLRFESKLKDYDAMLVNLVHDEWQTEGPNNVDIMIKICKMKADALKEVGEELKINCPLAGSYWNDDLHDYTIGTNWSVTH